LEQHTCSIDGDATEGEKDRFLTEIFISTNLMVFGHRLNFAFQMKPVLIHDTDARFSQYTG
jgi:hypothetical protein